MNIDNEHLHNMLMPKDCDTNRFSDKRVAYFKEFGFKVSSIYSEIYPIYNGIESDRYLPASLYYYYITPFLCNLNFMEAYVDKNIYHFLFPDVKQPSTIVRCINGRYYTSNLQELSLEDAISALSSHYSFIIKPSLETGGGNGVSKIKKHDSQDWKLTINSTIKAYGDNWIAQVQVKNSKEMATFNASSLNTMRIYTFRTTNRPTNQQTYVELGSTLRFGGKGMDVDNACSGGGFMAIDKEGNLSERVWRYADFKPYTTNDFGFKPFKLSKFAEAKELCLKLHSRLPYFDLIGWDIAVDDNDELILIEFNRTPDCEHFQIAHGPMFGEYLDDLLDKVKDNTTEFTVVAERSFKDGKQLSSHYFDFTRL